MAVVAHDPADQLASLQSALTARARALCGDQGPDPDAVVGADGSPLVHVHRLPARPGRTGTLARPLPPEVAERLDVDALWAHQARAIDLARAGRSVVVATGTASGKSLCYQVPIAEAAAAPVRRGTALLLFPTKALAHDQLRALTGFGFPGLVAGAYDGDTGNEERAWIRRHATAVLTNPEMLHSGILPHHDRWSTFLARLRYVVVDELHVFRGIFGSHVAHLLRRLRRLANHYGAEPTFVCCSATIGEPERLASALCGVPVEAVTEDASPRPERLVAVWNPPPLDEKTGARVSPNAETAGLVAELVRSGHTTLAFCRSRRATEVVAADVRRRLPSHLRRRVAAYRGGYLAEERREIEERLFSGRLDGVVATTALELGIDVGGLDAVVLNGFPGTVASFRQQAGRAGRSGRPSAAVLVAGSDQLDQWIAAHPHELVERPPEPVVVNPANPFVADAHLRCAAHEKPLTHEDERYWPGLLDEVVRRLVLDDQLVVHHRGRGRGPQALYAGGGWPAHGVGLRVGAGGQVTLRTEDGRAVGTVELARACEQAHPGASYLHAGQSWRVTELDLEGRCATVVPDDGTTYTVARTAVDIRVTSCDATRRVGGLEVGLGGVEVHQQVTGYQRKDALTGESLGVTPLDLPRSTLTTRAFWYRVPEGLLEAAGVGPREAPGALHAAEHAGIGVLPLFTICDRWDVGGVSTLHQPDIGGPAIVVYDGYQGGAGVAELGFEAAERHVRATAELVAACGCAAGCPSCVQSPKCGNGNEPLDKEGALALLRAALDPALAAAV
ncbi:MAG: DEAD/DEAH box helicase [Thermoanaerobacterales bacterium]|jgi:DEAD/DEAH box helicase domain-containing protein|nr:DEAD/DEAH box helicase [Thermoanaerobacterales bacterium]